MPIVGQTGVVAGVNSDDEPRERLLRPLIEDDDRESMLPSGPKASLSLEPKPASPAIQGCCQIPCDVKRRTGFGAKIFRTMSFASSETFGGGLLASPPPTPGSSTSLDSLVCTRGRSSGKRKSALQIFAYKDLGF